MRVLCAIGGGAALVGLVVALVLGGVEDNGYADFMGRTVVGFVLVVLASACTRALPWAMRNKGKAAAGVLLAIAAARAVWALSGVAPADGQGAAGPAASVDCSCSAGVVCTGPRGGRYCLRPDGAKKYQP